MALEVRRIVTGHPRTRRRPHGADELRPDRRRAGREGRKKADDPLTRRADRRAVRMPPGGAQAV